MHIQSVELNLQIHPVEPFANNEETLSVHLHVQRDDAGKDDVYNQMLTAHDIYHKVPHLFL